MSLKNQPSPQAVTPAAPVGTSSTEIAPVDSSRKFLLIVNNSVTDVFLGIAVPAIQGFGLCVQKDGGFIVFEEPGIIPEAAVNAIAESSTSLYIQGAI